MSLDLIYEFLSELNKIHQADRWSLLWKQDEIDILINLAEI